jgi:hypothetical protein
VPDLNNRDRYALQNRDPAGIGRSVQPVFVSNDGNRNDLWAQNREEDPRKPAGSHPLPTDPGIYVMNFHLTIHFLQSADKNMFALANPVSIHYNLKSRGIPQTMGHLPKKTPVLKLTDAMEEMDAFVQDSRYQGTS